MDNAHGVLEFQEFAAPSYEDWRTEAESALKGAPFVKKLVTQTPEEIDLQPIYNRADLAGCTDLDALPNQAPFIRGTRRESAWQVSQEVPDGGDFDLTLDGDPDSGSFSLNLALGERILTTDDCARTFAGADLDRCPLYLDLGSSSVVPTLALLGAWLRVSGLDLASLTGCVFYDPLAELVSKGELPTSLERAFEEMAITTAWAQNEMPGIRTIAVQSHVYHNAGGSAVEELAFAMGTGVEYLRQMEAHGLDITTTCSRMHFAFSMGPDFFMGIAKLRAARLLWSKIVASSGGGLEAQKMWIHARTSLWNRSRLDPYVNMLRGTTETLAAAVGGCDSLHVGPFDEVARVPEGFSRRMARNTQIIIRDECYISRVTDPAGGSYFIETLTRQLAQKAWALFQETEKQGGMIRALAAGTPQGAVSAKRALRKKGVAQRRISLIGTNTYANPSEQPLKAGTSSWNVNKPVSFFSPDELQKEMLARLSSAAPHELMELAIVAAICGANRDALSAALPRSRGDRASVAPLHQVRESQPYEDLRAAVASAGRPKVFLINIGPVRQHKARADFSTGFFEVGGFEVVAGEACSSLAAAIKSALAAAPRVVVICSTDESYPEIVPPLAAALKEHDPDRIVVLAGYPAEHVDAFGKCGVDEFIHMRANCPETLARIAKRLGIIV